MGLMLWLVLCVCAVAVATQSHNVTRRGSGSGPERRVVCYYTNWSVYRPGTAKFSPQNINPYLCTHLIYAFGGLTRENSLRPYDKYQDIEQGGYAKFTGLKTYNKQLKTLLAIGGWNEGSTRFSPLVADEERRAELVHNVVRFLRQNHFDGLDLDWEYPAFRDGGKPRDRENYALLVQELRTEFDRESAKTGRPRLLLTMAVPAGIEYIDKGYDIPKLNRYLDFMNILSYDYHSAFEPAVNHHSPLYPLEEESEYNFDAQLSIDYTVNHYVKLGADRDKLVLGIPTYGRSYTLFNPLASEIGSPADGPGEQGDATREKGYLAYYEICESLQSNDWKVEHPNPNAMGPYAYKGNQWVGYDDTNIVQLKSRYVSENGLGGIMFWSIDNDDFRGKCHGRPYPLIEAGKEALLASSGTSNDVVSVAPSRGSSKTRPKRPPNNSNSNRNSGNGSGRQSSQVGLRKKRPSPRRHNEEPARSSTTSTTSTTPAYNYPHTTPEPPTTPDPGSDFKCKDEGFFPHPRDCKKYFWCLDSGPSNLGIVAHQFTCPSGLFFNKGADSCDYARNVICKKKSGETGSTTTKAPPITAATSRTTRISSSTASTTTTTTTTTTSTAEPAAEAEDYDEDEYEDEEVDEEEDPQSIKELINLIKKLGGVEQLEKQLHLQDSEQDSKSGQMGSGFSRSLYDRVLSRSNNRGNSDFGGRTTTPSYTSPYRNRPGNPQNEGLGDLDEVKSLRREKPEYVTIRRDKPSTPEPEHDEEEEEEEEAEEGVVFQTDERNTNENSRPQSNPVEYVTIRRLRPSTTADTATTTPRYITIQRSRQPTPEQEVDDTGKDPDVQVTTTEIRPVYTGTTERQPETRIQIVTPIRTLVTEKPTGFRKQSRDEKVDRATLEPELKVSLGGFRHATSQSSLGTYPQYVDITSIGRRHNRTITEIGKDTSTSASPLEDPLPYVEVDSTTGRQNANDNSDFVDTVPSSSSPQPFTEPRVVESQPHYVDATSPARRRGTTLPTIGISKDTVTVKEHTTTDTNPRKYIDISKHRSTTVPSFSDVPMRETYKPKHDNNILRRRSTTVRTTDILAKETEPVATEDSVVQTIPSSTIPTSMTESNSQGPSFPDTIPTPTTTRFTPTVTRIVTSVTESGTTERQIIAVNRVPYKAIAALRGEKLYPGPLVHNRQNQTTTTTVSFQSRPSSNSFLEGTTTPVTVTEEHVEKVMEVNRIKLVTSKEELPLPYTRAVSGNESTEKMVVGTESEKTIDRVSEVSRLKHVTVVGGHETITPLGDYTTDILREEFTTLPTIPDIQTDRIYHENSIDTHGENPTSIPEYYQTTSTLHLDSISKHSEPLMEPIPPPVTEKQTESIGAIDEIGSTDIPPRTVTLNNRRRQGSGRKPGVDDFRARRTRPTFSTTTAEPQLSSTLSTFSQKRRGQRKRPRPYRPTSTNAAEEASVFTVQNHSNVANATANAEPNKEPRRTFIPSRGQRKRPRPYPQTSTQTTADEVINSVEKDRSEINILANERTSNATLGFIPKRGNRRRGKDQKGITETSNTTSTNTTQKDILSATHNVSADVDNSFIVVSKAGNTEGSSDNAKPSTQVLEIFSPETRPKFVPRKVHINRNFSTESNMNSTKDSGEFDISDNNYSSSTDSVVFTTDTSPLTQFELDVTELIPYLNSTGKYTDGSVPEEKETSRPSSVTPASIKSSSLASRIRGRGESDRVRIKKIRRRPTTHSSDTPPTEARKSPTESSNESQITSRNKLNVTQNEMKSSDFISDTNLSVNTVEENSVTPFATAALFGRENYDVSTPASVSEFVTTVDIEGKHVVEIFDLNGTNDRYVPHMTQKSKSASTKNNSKLKNATARNTSNDFEISFHNSELTTSKDSDLNTDGSGYAKGSTGRKSIYPLSTFARTTSEGIHDSALTTTVEVLSDGNREQISHKNSAKTSTKKQSTDNFIASVDFIADSRDDETLGSTPATGRNKPVSENTEGKTWRLVRRKRPSSTTVEPEAESEVVTTTTRSLRRPTGALYNPNRVRQRSTTTTTTTTTETPAASTESHQQRRQPGARLVRRRKYGSSSNRTRDSDATASDVQPSDSSNVASTDKDSSGGRVRKYSFPRRRPNTTSLPVTTRPVPVTTLPTNDAHENTQDEIQLLESKEHQSTDAEVGYELTTTKLPDLANSAVVAIHNLAIVPPTTQPIPEVVKSTRTSAATPTFSPTASTPATAPLFPRRGSTVFVSEEPSPSSPSLASPRRLPGNLSHRPRPFSKTTPRPAPETSTLARTSRPRQPPIVDYEYYDDEDVGILDVAPVSGKVKIHSDGYIECLDRGNFPHPFSCKKFISCAKMENGELLGWEYTCPRQLSFDPIGGICNWSAGLGCKE